MIKTITFLYDCIRSPFDISQIIQLQDKTDIKIITSRQSLPFQHEKVLQKCSVAKDKMRKVSNYNNLEELIYDYKERECYIVGTSPASTKSIYDLDLNNKDVMFVFGNESSGLPVKIQAIMDEMIVLPMNNENLSFMTLPVVTGAIATECYRIRHDNLKSIEFNKIKKHVTLVFSGIKSFYDSCLIIQAILALDYDNINIYTTKDNIDLTSNKIKNKIMSWRAKKMPNIIQLNSLENIISLLKEENKFVVGTYIKKSIPNNYDELFNFKTADKDIAYVFGNISKSDEKNMDYMLPLPISDSKSLPINFSSILFETYRQKFVK